ncbi:MAG: SH3 domain-containing protein [Bacteroidales bacterium]|jgi:hypothetical protein|nr:SH3 domain-containing protein [Bacteroidales bacterium]
MANVHIDLYVKEWNELIGNVKSEIVSGREKWVNPPVHGKLFDELIYYWKYNDFDATVCKQLVSKFKSVVEKPLGPNNFKTNLQSIRRVFNQTHTQDKATFEEFQKALGGKRKKQEQKQERDRKQEYNNSNDNQVIWWNSGWYSGEINARNEPDGQGEWQGNNGDIETGIFRNGYLNGTNSVRYDAKYKRTDRGVFTNGNRTGTGIMEWDNGDWYKGAWSNSGRHGKGEQHFSNGDWYTAYWENDKIVGYVIYHNKNGIIERGYWDKNNNWHKHRGFFKLLWDNFAAIAFVIITIATLWTFIIDGLWMGLSVAAAGAAGSIFVWLAVKLLIGIFTGIWKNRWFFLILLITGVLCYLGNRSCNREDGWLNKISTNKAITDETEVAVVIVKTLNMRSTPNGNVIRKLSRGDKLTVKGKAKKGWLPVEFSGVSGYVSTKYVRMSDNLSALPLLPPL